MLWYRWNIDKAEIFNMPSLTASARKSWICPVFISYFSLFPFSSSETALLLTLWEGSTPEVHDLRTSHHSAHAPSQVWQIWLAEIRTLSEAMILGTDQKEFGLWGREWACFLMLFYVFEFWPYFLNKHLFQLIGESF